MKVLNNIDLSNNEIKNNSPLSLKGGGTGSDSLGQEIGVVTYNNNGNSLEILDTWNEGFLYSSGGRNLPEWVNIQDYIVNSYLVSTEVSSGQQTVNFNWSVQRYSDNQIRAWAKFNILVYPYSESSGLGDGCKYQYTLNIPLPATFSSVQNYSKFIMAQTGFGITIVDTGGLNDNISSIAAHWASNVDARSEGESTTLQLQIMGQI